MFTNSREKQIGQSCNLSNYVLATFPNFTRSASNTVHLQHHIPNEHKLTTTGPSYVSTRIRIRVSACFYLSSIAIRNNAEPRFFRSLSTNLRSTKLKPITSISRATVIDPRELRTIHSNPQAATVDILDLHRVRNRRAQRRLLQNGIALHIAAAAAAQAQPPPRRGQGPGAAPDPLRSLAVAGAHQLLAVRQEAADPPARGVGAAGEEAEGRAEVGGVAGGRAEEEEELLGGGEAGGGGGGRAAAGGGAVEGGAGRSGERRRRRRRRRERGEAGGAVRGEEGVVEGERERSDRRRDVFADGDVRRRSHRHLHLLKTALLRRRCATVVNRKECS